MPALLREHQDAYGHLMLDHLEGRPAEEIVERDDGYIYLGAGPGLYFAPYLSGDPASGSRCGMSAAMSSMWVAVREGHSCTFVTAGSVRLG